MTLTEDYAAAFDRLDTAQERLDSALESIRPVRPVSVGIRVGATVLTVPVSESIRQVIEDWGDEHIEDLHRRLAPYGINAYDIVRPEYSRVVTKEDLPGQ